MAVPQLESLRRAVATVGSQSATARLLGVTQAAVWKWVQGTVELPPKHVIPLEEATGISRHDLRPDIYPPEPPTRATHVRAATPDHLRFAAQEPAR